MTKTPETIRYFQSNGCLRQKTSCHTNLTDFLRVYVQDQVTLAENLKLLLGARFDLFEQTTENPIINIERYQSADAFSPRVESRSYKKGKCLSFPCIYPIICDRFTESTRRIPL